MSFVVAQGDERSKLFYFQVREVINSTSKWEASLLKFRLVL